MKPFTATELKAMKWYMEENRLQLTLSQPPIIFFLQEDGETHKRRIDHILNEYKNRKQNKELA